jgi:putative transposase
MKYNPQYHNRKSIRLKGYDYSQNGAYFVTICTYQRRCFFGEIRDGKMELNQIGKIVAQEWLKSSEIRQEIELDQWVIMPNHLHGIVIIDHEGKINHYKEGNHNQRINHKDQTINHKGSTPLTPTKSLKYHQKPRSLSSLISGFKSAVTKQINQMRKSCDIPIWQRNYYETIIRDEKAYYNIQEYIMTNPQKWIDDPEYEKNDFEETQLMLDLLF